MGKKSHIVYRRNSDGQIITKEKADQLGPSKVTKEQMPNPGYGDTK